jgi:hypothetical protein
LRIVLSTEINNVSNKGFCVPRGHFFPAGDECRDGEGKGGFAVAGVALDHGDFIKEFQF